jgi:hypothetical protein
VADELFAERGLSPRRVSFYLAHWGELEAMAESPATSGSVREYLRREWVHLQDKHPSIACICGPTDQEPLRPRGYGGSSGYGPAVSFASDLRVTLLNAADALPFPWRATRRVYLLQWRPGEWEHIKRFDLWRHDARRDQRCDLQPEPRGAEEYVDQLVHHMMARSTGWVRRPNVDAESRPAAHLR